MGLGVGSVQSNSLVWVVAAVLVCAVGVVQGGDPYIFFTWNVTYGIKSPLGVPQKVILINDQFPGPNINSTTNNNVVVNVFNNLDEPFLLTWNGVQQRKNSWQDGLPGTNCPIMPGTNYTFQFQVKDQIGSYFYYPTLGMHRAIGAFGGLRINSRLLIPVPFADPADDFTVLIGDWYQKNHTDLCRILDKGRSLGRPDGVLINGQNGQQPGAKTLSMFTVDPRKTYRFRICNVGLRNSLNFRIQGHNMLLVETEGSHTMQAKYVSLDIHLGQCYSVLVTADQPPRDYYMIASTRFTKYMLNATAILRYGGTLTPPSNDLPKAPEGWAWSLNQFRSFRWNLTASAARPNPQGSYHFGEINISRTIKLANSAGIVDGKLRYAVNGVSNTDPETPVKLAEYFNVADKVFKYDLMGDNPPADLNKITIQPNVINATFRNFIEIVFENHEKSVQSWHLNGYSFFAVAIRPGTWTPESRKFYNLLDAVSRNTIQVYPKSWAAILLTFDNAGMWNLKAQTWERQYLGQQLYISVLSPSRSLRDEYSLPDGFPLCGVVKGMSIPPPYTI